MIWQSDHRWRQGVQQMCWSQKVEISSPWVWGMWGVKGLMKGRGRAHMLTASILRRRECRRCRSMTPILLEHDLLSFQRFSRTFRARSSHSPSLRELSVNHHVSMIPVRMSLSIVIRVLSTSNGRYTVTDALIFNIFAHYWTHSLVSEVSKEARSAWPARCM